MRILSIDYGDARTGIAITDALNITVQGLETIHNEGSDKIILKRLDEILEKYDIDTNIPRFIELKETFYDALDKNIEKLEELDTRYNKENLIKSAFAFYRRNGLIIKDNYILDLMGLSGKNDEEIIRHFEKMLQDENK